MGSTTQVRTDYSSIALIVDRSGSMESVAEDTKGGIKQFITTQKQNEARASFTLVQFDSEYEVLNDFSDLNKVDENAFAKQYQPRGSTALLDAIGRTVSEMSQKIEKMDLSERPAHVIVAIVTDGQENASRDFTVAKVKKLIEEKQARGWDFVFLGADLNAITVAKNYGFDSRQVAYYDSSNISEALGSIGKQVSVVRNGSKVSFSPDERKQLAATKV